MAHLVGCQAFWIGRLRRENQLAAVWPQLSLEECAQQLDELANAWKDLLAGLTFKTSPKSPRAS